MAVVTVVFTFSAIDIVGCKEEERGVMMTSDDYASLRCRHQTSSPG